MAFTTVRGVLHAEGVPLSAVADAVGTPTYVYSSAAVRDRLSALTRALAPVPHLVCYSVKANGNLALLKLLAGAGAGFDIVSGGELARVRAAGGDPGRVVFAGVGKTRGEMADALAAGVRLFNVESAEELALLDAVGREAGRRAPFALRVNPDVDAGTHRHISTGHGASKFGVPFAEARALYARARRMKGVQALGVDCHIGSQLTRVAPLRKAFGRVAELYRALKAEGHPLTHLDLGGGLGITYADEAPPTVEDWAAAALEAARATGAHLVLEPGRSLVGNAGVLLARVLFRKRTAHKTFVIVDAGMNDLVRPALYDAHHGLVPVRARGGTPQAVEVVGPLCESTALLARAGDVLAFLGAGAYGMSMASNYNARPRPAEVLVDGEAWRVVRERERPEDLWRGEHP